MRQYTSGRNRVRRSLCPTTQRFPSADILSAGDDLRDVEMLNRLVDQARQLADRGCSWLILDLSSCRRADSKAAATVCVIAGIARRAQVQFDLICSPPLAMWLDLLKIPLGFTCVDVGAERSSHGLALEQLKMSIDTWLISATFVSTNETISSPVARAP